METFRGKLIMQGVIFILLVGSLASGLSFFRRQITRSRENIVFLRNTFAENIALVRTFTTLKTQYEPTGKRALATLYKIIPLQGNIITLGKDFRTLAVQDGLTISFVWGEEKQPTGESFGTIGFTLTLTGEKNKLYSFLEALSRFRYLVVIDALNITSNEPQSTLTINGKIFFR